jgi:hypothetical protein
MILLLIIIKIIREVYKSQKIGHTGRAKTIKIIENNKYFILKTVKLIRRFL